MVNSKKFSERIQKIMDEYDLNATAFADQIDVGRSSISHILSGRNKPSLDFVMKVIEAFPKVELYWLLNGKGDFPKETNGQDQLRSATPSINRDLFNTESVPSKESLSASHTALTADASKKEIARIVFFFTDGSFEAYAPSQE